LNSQRVVLVFGLAGSGKSTLAKRLATEFHLRKIHPSGVIRDILEGKALNPEASSANDGFWESEEGARILEARLTETRPIDIEVNNILLQEVDKGNVVIDTWSLPWLTEKGIRFHLRAPLSVRAERAAKRAGIAFDQSRLLIDKKDNDTRQLFRRLYGFDIKNDHHVFHDTIDTTDLSAESVFQQAREYLNLQWSLE
jgi:CMP/dCMP kinase